jgi:hypothetical protein
MRWIEPVIGVGLRSVELPGSGVTEIGVGVRTSDGGVSRRESPGGFPGGRCESLTVASCDG